jgi:hypothetical protein
VRGPITACLPTILPFDEFSLARDALTALHGQAVTPVFAGSFTTIDSRRDAGSWVDWSNQMRRGPDRLRRDVYILAISRCHPCADVGRRKQPLWALAALATATDVGSLDARRPRRAPSSRSAAWLNSSSLDPAADGRWMGEGRPEGGHALAILPGFTHYNLAVSPLFAAVALAFLDEQPS